MPAIDGASIAGPSSGIEGVNMAGPSSGGEGASIAGTSAGSEGARVAGPSSRVTEGTGSSLESVPGATVEENSGGSAADPSPKTSFGNIC